MFSVFDGIKWHTVQSKTAISQEWTHISATYSNEQIKIFVNGAQEGSIQIDSDYSLTHQYGESTQNSYDHISLQSNVVIGAFSLNARDNASLSNHFSGLIDDVTLYDKLLSSENISTLDENKRTPDEIQEPESQPAQSEPEQTGTENEYGFVTDDDNPNDQKIEEVAAEGYKVKKPEETKKKDKQNQASEKAKEALEENKSTADQSTEEAVDESTEEAVDESTEEAVDESGVEEFDESVQISTSSNSTTSEPLPTAPQKTAPLSEEYVADSDSLIRKLVRVSSDTEASDLPPINSKTQYKWKLYGDLNGTLVDLTNDPNVDLQLLDLNSDNSLDRAEWSTTDGITEYYLVAKIILATAGLHLDSEREFVDDIFYEIKEKDGIWTYDIPAGDFVRVTFERSLDSNYHIAIFAQSIGFASIEVYEKDGTELIATFNDVSDPALSKAKLTNLSGNQDTFDLKVIGAPIQFDQIIDPATIDIQQCHNAKPNINNCEHISANQKYFATGQAGSSNSIIGFGHSQNYRIIFEDIATKECTGQPEQNGKILEAPDCRPPEGWTLIIEQDLTQGGEIAQDFWTGPGNILTAKQPSGTGIYPCSLDGVLDHYCPGTMDKPTIFLIPRIMGNVTNGTNTDGIPSYVDATTDSLGIENVTDAQMKHISLLAQPYNQDQGALQYMHIWGVGEGNATFIGIDNATEFPYSLENGNNFELGNSQMRGTIMFNNTNSTIVLAYGGHIADALDYPPDQITPGGSPYHNRIISFDGVRGDTGNQDVQLDLVPPEPSVITIIKETNDPDNPQKFNFTATFQWNNTVSEEVQLTTGENASSKFLPPANYTIYEDDFIAEGWVLDSVVCEEANVNFLNLENYKGGDIDSVATVYSDNTVNIWLAIGEQVTCTFTNITPQNELRGQKYHDLDANGDWDEGEPYLNDWIIFLDGMEPMYLQIFLMAATLSVKYWQEEIGYNPNQE
jgi:hypothetical protein